MRGLQVLLPPSSFFVMFVVSRVGRGGNHLRLCWCICSHICVIVRYLRE